MNRVAGMWATAIGKKVTMAVTGIVMVGFLISHAISNVLIFVNPQHLDDYAAWLRSLGPLLWLARVGLLAAVVIHIAAAWQLTRMAHAARPRSYGKYQQRVSSYAGRTMRWGGVLLVLFIVFHILHLTFGKFHPDYHPGQPSHNVIAGLAVTPVAIFYLLAMVALGGHFAHGIWSALQTVGLNHPGYNRMRVIIAITLAVLVAGGLASIPLAALLGFLS